MDKDIKKADLGAQETQQIGGHAASEIEQIPPATANSTSTDSEHTARDPEEELEEARRNNPNGLTRTVSGISVRQATDDFHQLERKFSNLSRTSQKEAAHKDSWNQLRREFSNVSHRSRRGSKGAASEKGKDAGVKQEEATLESGTGSSTEEEERFDLETVLRTGLDAEQKAGIRPKHIGVIWENFTVKGMGGASNFVKTFPK